MGESKAVSSRMENLDALRCIAMLMVVVLHYLGKGELLQDLTTTPLTAVGCVSWLLEAFAIAAVNIYMLISGYFLSMSSFRLSRMLRLYVQLWMYSALVGVVAACVGLVPAEEMTAHYFFTLLFPVSMGHYWFLTAYFFLCVLLPLVGGSLCRMTSGQMRLTLFLLLFTFCLCKSILPLRLEEDGQGYDCIWYLTVFVAAAYLGRFGSRFLLNRRNAILLYLLGVVGVYAEAMALHVIYVRSGSMGLLLKISYEYNHIFPFAAALGLFSFFLSRDLAGKKGVAVHFLSRFAPYSLGVYLLHENIGVRYAWQSLFGAGLVGESVGRLLVSTLLAAIVVFAVGALAEFLRSRLVSFLHRVLLHSKPYRALVEQIVKADALFAEGKQ